MVQLAEEEPGAAGSSPVVCTRCGRTLRKGRIFAVNTVLAAGETATDKGVLTQPALNAKCFQCALRHGPMLRRSLLVALVIGTILAFLNHGDTFLTGNWRPGLYWKVPLTYLVPFCVATFGALANCRR